MSISHFAIQPLTEVPMNRVSPQLFVTSEHIISEIISTSFDRPLSWGAVGEFPEVLEPVCISVWGVDCGDAAAAAAVGAAAAFGGFLAFVVP